MAASNDVFRRQDSLRLSQVSIPESQLIGSILSDTAHTKAPNDPEKSSSSPSHTDSQLKMPSAVSGIPPTLHQGFLRSTSAPPQLSVDPHGFGNASTAIFMNGESVLPDDPRLTPAYYAYYYSQRPLDPRLPPPLLDYSTWNDAPDQQQQSVAPHDDQSVSHGPTNEFFSPNAFRQVLHQPKPIPGSSFEVGFESSARSWSEKTAAPASKAPADNPQGFAGPLGMIQQDFPRTPSPLFPSEQPTEAIDSVNFNLNGDDVNNYSPESFEPTAPLMVPDPHASDNGPMPELQQQMQSMKLASCDSAPSQSRPRAFETQPQAQPQLDHVQQQFQTPQTSQSGLVFPSNAMFAPAPMAPYRNVSGISPMIAVMGYGQGQKPSGVRQRQQQQQQRQQHQLHHPPQKSRMMPLHSAAMFGVQQQQQQQQQRLMQNQQQQSYQEYISPHQRPAMSHSQSFGVQQQQLDSVPPQAVGFRQRSTPQQYWAPPYHSMPSQPQQQHYGHQHQHQQYIQSQRMQQQQWYGQAQQQLQQHQHQQQPRGKGARRYNSQQASQKHPRDGVAVSGMNGGGSSRSLILHELRTNKHNHCVRLEDVLAQHLVSDLATDQNGSRFIQQQLESSTDAQKQALFEQLLPDTIRLCVDVFGNYVIQKFFEFGLPSQRRLLAEQLRGNVLSLSLQMYGCRVVQKAIEMVDEELQSELVQELSAHVIKCIKDQNGNHVIQKCIEQIPPHHIAFIIDAFVGHVFSLSTHAYGCRVVQRLLENCKGDAKVNSLILSEILEKALQLVVDQYGNYVIQHVIQRGDPAHRSSVIHQIQGRIGELSKHKFASNVIEKCFAFANDADKEALVNEVIGNDKVCPVASMVKDQYANYVVQKILGVVETTQRDRLIETIRTSVPNLRKIAFGKHIVARVEKLTGKVIG